MAWLHSKSDTVMCHISHIKGAFTVGTVLMTCVIVYSVINRFSVITKMETSGNQLWDQRVMYVSRTLHMSAQGHSNISSVTTYTMKPRLDQMNNSSSWDNTSSLQKPTNITEKRKILTVDKFNNNMLAVNLTDKKNKQKNITHVESNFSNPASDKVRGWYLSSQSQYTMFVHSAFYDDRQAARHSASVRILAISDMTNTTTYCNFWFGNTQSHTKVKASCKEGYLHKTDKTIHRHVKSRGIFKEYVISCKLPVNNKQLPSHVTVSTNVSSQSPITIPVTVPQKLQTRLNVGVCVSISYGTISKAEFAEWIELNKLFGVREFNVYFAFVSNETKRLLDYYQAKGDVIYHDMPTIIPVSGNVTTSKQYVRLNIQASLNHCLYSNMYRYKSIAVIDYDEVIVPRQHMTYSELLDKFKALYGQGDNWVSYTFRNVYFFLDTTPDENQPEYLPKLRHIKKTEPSPYLHRPKSLINPDLCTIVGSHYCIQAFRGNLKTDVPVDIASSHHYRQSSNEKTKNDFMTKDTILWRYKQKLINATKPVLKEFTLIS